MTRITVFKIISVLIVLIVISFSSATLAIYLATDSLKGLQPDWVISLQLILIRTNGFLAGVSASILEAVPVVFSLAIFKTDKVGVVNFNAKLTPFEITILILVFVGAVLSIVGLLIFDKESKDQALSLEYGFTALIRIVEINQIVLRYCLILGSLILGLKKISI